MRGFRTGISHHDSLIPGSIGKSALNRNSPCPAFSGTFHCPGDIRTLFVDEGIHVDSFRFMAAFEGDIPGASEVECGNYRDMDLPAAKAEAAAMLPVLEALTADQLHY